MRHVRAEWLRLPRVRSVWQQYFNNSIRCHWMGNSLLLYMEMKYLLFLLTSLFCINASAVTYYVSPAGSDSSAGTQSSPWRTFQHASDAMSAGDTALFAGGTYQE